MEHNLTLRDGRALKVRDWPGRGRPLVLLHGLLDSGAGWDKLARAVPYRCLAIDLPGFGDSDPPLRPRFSAYADAIVEGLGAIGVSSLTLVGHSLGGGVATAVAERIPHDVGALLGLCARRVRSHSSRRVGGAAAGFRACGRRSAAPGHPLVSDRPRVCEVRDDGCRPDRGAAPPAGGGCQTRRPWPPSRPRGAGGRWALERRVLPPPDRLRRPCGCGLGRAGRPSLTYARRRPAQRSAAGRG